MKNIFILFVIAIFTWNCNPPSPLSEVPLLDANWTFRQADNSTWYPATVPGCVHTDLLNNGLIEMPFYADNEIKQRWIEEKEWVYQTEFEVNNALLKNDHIQFNFKGLDTYAYILINGRVILETDNMFRQWTKEGKPYLKKGKNQLTIFFKSPIEHNRAKVENYPQTLPSGNEPDDISLKVYSFTRKAAYHFGWDWGPRFVTSGIWKPITITAWNQAKINTVYTRTRSIEQGKAKLQTSIQVQVAEPGLYTIQIDTTSIERHLDKGEQTIEYPFEIKNPKLWWCNGNGEAHLYPQKITLLKNENKLDEKDIQYGVRTIELINERDSIGTSFYFKLNGQPIFMKGANYIPQDMFLNRVSKADYEQLILDAKAANMNMLRVWGGGIYEKDIFYDLCDKHGILVWQDFMFACSLYPDLPEFHQNIKAEIEDNVKRLRNHPCIALWCGNNEIEVAWKNWGWQDKFGYSEADSIAIWNNYLHIFHDLIPNTLAPLDDTRAYTTSSPLSNWGTPENFKHSSMHYWGVWHGRETFENFENNVGRFMAEYGFQSFPSIKTLEQVIPDSAMYLASDIMNMRQKSYIGNGLIRKHIEQYHPKPKSFADFVERSQQTQAKGMKMAINSHRNKQPHCMGTLFWQFNDCWPGPSWSVIDYYGNKKAAYYTVQEAYE